MNDKVSIYFIIKQVMWTAFIFNIGTLEFGLGSYDEE